MKIRKSLLAIATTATIITAGVTAEANAQELSSNLTALSSSSSESAAETTTTESGEEPEDEVTNADEGSSSDPDVIKSWLGVATAVIGVASSLFAFFAKNIAPLVIQK